MFCKIRVVDEDVSEVGVGIVSSVPGFAHDAFSVKLKKVALRVDIRYRKPVSICPNVCGNFKSTVDANFGRFVEEVVKEEEATMFWHAAQSGQELL